MYRVMVVDDEQNLADYTAVYLSCIQELELEVVTAYSSREALEKLAATPADVLISDIQMPGMSGLELLGKTRQLWPLCQCILLTAHERFSYAMEAINVEALFYVLKSEGMDRLGEAVRKAISRLEDTAQERRILESAKEQAQAAIPFLQREFLMELVHGTVYTPDMLEKTRSQLRMQVDVRQPTSIATILVHTHAGEDTLLERMERSAALHLLAQASLPDTAAFCQVEIDAHRLIWLIQNHGGLEHRLGGFFQGIQRACLGQLKLPISICYTKACPDASHMARLYKRLHARQASQAVSHMPAWIICVDGESDPAEEFVNQDSSMAEEWRKAYERGDPSADAQLRKLLKPLKEASSSAQSAQAKECYLLVAAQFSRMLNNMNLTSAQKEHMHIHLLYDPSAHASARQAYDYLIGLAQTVTALRQENSSNSARMTIEKLDRYIAEHMSDDLSLTRLAEVADMNASYLSRLYKQETGQNLASTIARMKMDRAHLLLADPSQKIQDISKALGFPNPAYFSYFYKKYENITPKEYREHLLEKSTNR